MRSNKKLTAVKGMPQPFNRHAGSVYHAKPVVAQLKTPIAPPVYRPQPMPKVLQRKSALSLGSAASRTLHAPVAPPVYRPEVKLIQQKANLLLRKPPTSPPAYRGAQKGASVLTGHRPTYASVSRSVVQRAEERKFVFKEEDIDPENAVIPEAMEWEGLSEIAESLNKSASKNKQLDGRHVQAVTLDKGGRIMVFTQKWRTAMGDVEVPNIFEPEDKDYVVRHKKDNHLHAEMLAISSYLTGQSKLPLYIGVSKPVCARCSVVLDFFKIPHYTDGDLTDSWVSPWKHANLSPPIALKGKIPKTVRKKRVFPYKDSEWE